MNNTDVIKFFKDQFEEDPEFRAFIERFGEAYVKPAIKLVQEGKDAEAKKYLEAGFIATTATVNPEVATNLLKYLDKEEIK